MAFTRSRSNSGIGDWYTASYSNTISRLRTTPFMPGANFEQTTAQLHDLEATTTNMSSLSGPHGGNHTVRDRVQVLDATTGLPMTSRQIAQATDATNQTGGIGSNGGANAGPQKKKGQTLFGPDVGFEEADAVGGWTKADAAIDNQREQEETTTPTVPLGVVKTWIERAKTTETDSTNAHVHKTTTLQAMVNLKRPSLSLIALTAAHPEDHEVQAGGETHSTAHALRFTYDASSPAVLVTLTIHPRSYPPLTAKRPIMTVYSARHDGGFGKTWQLPDGFTMDLQHMMDEESRLKQDAKTAQEEEDERRRRSAAMDGEEDDEDDDLKKRMSRRHSRSAHHPTIPASGPTPVSQSSTPEAANSTPSRSRFGISGLFGRRQQRQDEEQGIVAGIRNSQGGSAAVGGRGGDVIEMQPTTTPAANATPATAADGQDKDKDKDVMEEDGIRVLIRLDALDAHGNKLFPSNAQLTHALLTGTPISSASTHDINAQPAPEEASISPVSAQAQPTSVATPVKRSWALKVVRREAIIANHTFLLKEIYGLSSASATDADINHNAGVPNDTPDPYASTPNECIVCLTNARDVVLLPCRHLVVCRECALGMIEFGAGGKVARREETSGNVDASGSGAAAGAGDGSTADAAPAPVPATTTRERRKRKAKGWFCPVCRQPYTSLLRLALPAPVNHANDQVEVEETADENADTATIRSFRTTRTARSVAGHSLHRVSSRATLPERGERMLRELAPDADDDDEDDEDDLHAAHRPAMSEQEQPQRIPVHGRATPSYPPRPQETEGERRERIQQEEMDKQEAQGQQREPYQPAPFVLGNEVDVQSPPAETTPEPLSAHDNEGKRPSLEGTGWRAVA